MPEGIVAVLNFQSGVRSKRLRLTGGTMGQLVNRVRGWAQSISKNNRKDKNGYALTSSNRFPNPL